jgi:GNAT superfamily N-acetyltransferase
MTARDAVLAAFDVQIRRRPQPDAGQRVEHDRGVVRAVADAGGWSGVTWSCLDADNADAVIAAQIARFGALPGSWEWKHYSYDRPSDLPERLLAAGFTREPAESLLVAAIADVALDTPAPPGVGLRETADAADMDVLVALHDAVFGGDHSGVGAALLAGIEREPRTAAGVIAYAGEAPIAAARVEFHQGTDFASLWGGGALPAWRGRGVFGALVAHRARLAAHRGFRYLQVDALPTSRPILERLGFVELATTTPFTHPGGK